METKYGAIVSSRCFENYIVQSLTDKLWRIYVSIAAHISEHGNINSISFTSWKMRINPKILEESLNLFVEIDLMDLDDFVYSFPGCLDDPAIEILR